MVTSEPVGLVLKSSISEGMSGTASGNSSVKKRRISSFVFVVAKLRGPSNSQKSVQVNDPSGFGSAIIMKLLRGSHGRLCRRYLKMRDRSFEVDSGAAMIEMHANIWITLRGFDNGGIKSGTTN